MQIFGVLFSERTMCSHPEVMNDDREAFLQALNCGGSDEGRDGAGKCVLHYAARGGQFLGLQSWGAGVGWELESGTGEVWSLVEFFCLVSGAPPAI